MLSGTRLIDNKPQQPWWHRSGTQAVASVTRLRAPCSMYTEAEAILQFGKLLSDIF